VQLTAIISTFLFKFTTQQRLLFKHFHITSH